MVEEEHPLKQGLKQEKWYITRWSNCVEEEHPLKQGLKLYTAILTIKFK